MQCVPISHQDRATPDIFLLCSVTEETPSSSLATTQRQWTPPYQRKVGYVDWGELSKPSTNSLAPDMPWSGYGTDRPCQWTQRHGPYHTFVARTRAPTSYFATSLQHWGRRHQELFLTPPRTSRHTASTYTQQLTQGGKEWEGGGRSILNRNIYIFQHHLPSRAKAKKWEIYCWNS